jgi:hypothetical protein
LTGIERTIFFVSVLSPFFTLYPSLPPRADTKQSNPTPQIKNASDRDAFDESMWAGEGREEVSGWIEGFLAKALGEDVEEVGGRGGSGDANKVEKEKVHGEEVEEIHEKQIVEDGDVSERTEKLSLDA